MADKSAIDVLAEVVTSAAERAVKNAKFDVSAYGVITEKEDQHYKIAVFRRDFAHLRTLCFVAFAPATEQSYKPRFRYRPSG